MTPPKPSSTDQDTSRAAPRVLTVSLRRVRRGRAVAFAPTEPEPMSPPKPRASRAAQMLALAHEFQRLIDEGEVTDRAALAAQVGLTRARVTQIMDLLLLAPDIQEDILVQGVCARSCAGERSLRGVARIGPWSQQRLRWAHDQCTFD